MTNRPTYWVIIETFKRTGLCLKVNPLESVKLCCFTEYNDLYPF